MVQQATADIDQALFGNGLYAKGVVLSSQARAFRKKDGSGLNVKVTHEIATQPGVVLWEEFHDPTKSTDFLMEGETVMAFPKLPDFKEVLIRFKRFREFNKTLIISDVEVLA
jgi:hypothetical protein